MTDPCAQWSTRKEKAKKGGFPPASAGLVSRTRTLGRVSELRGLVSLTCLSRVYTLSPKGRACSQAKPSLFLASGRPSFLRATRGERKLKLCKLLAKKGVERKIRDCSLGPRRSPLVHALVSPARILPCLKRKIKILLLVYSRSRCFHTQRTARDRGFPLCLTALMKEYHS